MKIQKIGYDPFLEKDIKKYVFDKPPKLRIFNAIDVIAGNASSNIAICFAYNWKTDFAPKNIQEFFQKVSNYAALTGFWRTTNGGRYAFANLLANPNINKLVMLVFGEEDNGHLIADALTKLWKHGTDEEGNIKNSQAANPRFEQVPFEALERARKQMDLVVVRNIGDDLNEVEELIKSCYQEPENHKTKEHFPKLEIEIFSNINNNKLYDDGARFEKPFNFEILGTHVKFMRKELHKVLGQSVQAHNLEDALEIITAFVKEQGSGFCDERKIINLECRSFTVTIIDALEKIPKGFSEDYIKKYVDEFMNGATGKGFAYGYHDRIFKRWGNQVERAIKKMSQNPETRRALISLWDPEKDMESQSAPCLDLIWLVVRNDILEMHVVFRSHHLSTITDDGKMMWGEGALVPNMYALATLHESMAKKLGMNRGPMVLTDFSGHLYVNKIGYDWK